MFKFILRVIGAFVISMVLIISLSNIIFPRLRSNFINLQPNSYQVTLEKDVRKKWAEFVTVMYWHQGKDITFWTTGEDNKILNIKDNHLDVLGEPTIYDDAKNLDFKCIVFHHQGQKTIIDFIRKEKPIIKKRKTTDT